MAHEQKRRPFENDIGFYIKQQGYSIAQFAAMTRIPRRTLTAYIAGDYRIPRERLQIIAQKLRCPISVLLPKPGHLSAPPPKPTPRKPRTAHTEAATSASGTLLPAALQQFEAALAQLAPHETLRRANVLVSRGLAYVCMCERDASMDAAEKALPVLRALNAPTLNGQFHEYVLQGLVGLFPHDSQVRRFVSDAQHQLSQ